MKRIYLLFAVLLALAFACDTATGPNEIGGDTNLDLTKVGNEFGVSIKLVGDFIPSLQNIQDSVVITKNDNGIVTFSGKFSIDFEALKQVDTAIGTAGLSDNMKHQLVDYFLLKYNATIDTSNKESYKLFAEMKFKITSEGIQDFAHSNNDVSKPFTIVKYGSNVGDKYEFTKADGSKITRTVVEKNPEEDWDLSFWRVKTIKVEEVDPNDPLISKMTYVANHKFGLVGLIIEFKDGKKIITTVLPWDVM